MSSGTRSGDPDKRAEFEAALEWGWHATLGGHLYARDDDDRKEEDRG